MSQSPDDVPKVIVGPILTWAVCGICALVFAASSTLGDLNTWDAVSALGYLPAARIWGGEYWALWTSVFVHFELWHIAFNLYWLWTLGRSLELTAGRASWAALFILSAGISSVAQMAVSGDTGVGASGVVYAFFGFMWA
ncbi:MAG TPA: rhomboid family intramembrane serine protease, partial [Candidatus Polarisedimenticolia bacterium]|nr:rhomboid family intramembrane serine protease [Candidatus Polarisedimenticolia bacterium]